MILDDQEIALLVEYASLLLSISDIALLLVVDKDELKEEIANKETYISRRYHCGKLETIIKLRKQEIAQAELGSSTAIELVSKYIIDQSLDE